MLLNVFSSSIKMHQTQEDKFWLFLLYAKLRFKSMHVVVTKLVRGSREKRETSKGRRK